MKYKKYIPSILIFTAIGFICPIKSYAEWITHDFKDRGFSINLPEGWNKLENTSPYTPHALYFSPDVDIMPEDGIVGEGTSNRIMCIAQNPVGDPMHSLDGTRTGEVGSLRFYDKDLTVEEKNIAGEDARKIVFSFKDNNITKKQIRYVFFHGTLDGRRVLYRISINLTEDQFAANEILFDSIVNSIDFFD